MCTDTHRSYPRTEEEEIKSKGVWLKGHTGECGSHIRRGCVLTSLDFGSVTILWSQPVASLQILSPDGKWRYIKHIDNGIVCLTLIHDVLL